MTTSVLLTQYSQTKKGKLMHEIIFYNGFNLVFDIALVYVTYRIAKGIGYRQAERDNQPPF